MLPFPLLIWAYPLDHGFLGTSQSVALFGELKGVVREGSTQNNEFTYLVSVPQILLLPSLFLPTWAIEFDRMLKYPAGW